MVIRAVEIQFVLYCFTMNYTPRWTAKGGVPPPNFVCSYSIFKLTLIASSMVMRRVEDVVSIFLMRSFS